MKKNPEARRAALKRVLTRSDDVIQPKKARPIPESDPGQLMEVVERGYLKATIGELLEKARTSRKVGKRELARRMGSKSHARIAQLEEADNLEIRSVLEAANAVGYDVQIALIPHEGGQGFGAVLKMGKPGIARKQ